MGKVETYRLVLRELDDWDSYLLEESRLPGPRANLELAFAAAMEGSEPLFRRYAALDPDAAPANSSRVFLPVCGVLGLGYNLDHGRQDSIDRLRSFASDPRWRIREALALGLQHFGENYPEDLLAIMKVWSRGNLLERRAVVATLCEPALLREESSASQTIDILDDITTSILHEPDRKSDAFRTLRKTLGYGWSVAVVEQPARGKAQMEKWIQSPDKDIRWIMTQNLRKKRLVRLDADWTQQQLDRLENE